MRMRKNNVKTLWDNQQTALCGWIVSESTVIAEMVGGAGCDGVVVDLQHGASGTHRRRAAAPGGCQHAGPGPQTGSRSPHAYRRAAVGPGIYARQACRLRPAPRAGGTYLHTLPHAALARRVADGCGRLR